MRQLFPEWRDQNRDRKYPFSDGSTLISEDNSVFIPNNIFLDARIYPVGGSDRQWLSKIYTDAEKVWLVVSDSDRGEIAKGFYYINSQNTEKIEILDAQSRAAGVLVLDKNAGYFLSGILSASFSYEATAFCASVIVPVPETGSRIIQYENAYLTGDVWFVGGPGVVWTEEESNPVLNAVGDAYYRRRACETAGKPFEGDPCLLTINGVTPNSSGNIFIVPHSQNRLGALRISRSGNSIRIALAGGRTPDA